MSHLICLYISTVIQIPNVVVVVVPINVEMSFIYRTVFSLYCISSWNFACVYFRKFWPIWCKQEEICPLTFSWSRLDSQSYLFACFCLLKSVWVTAWITPLIIAFTGVFPYSFTSPEISVQCGRHCNREGDFAVL